MTYRVRRAAAKDSEIIARMVGEAAREDGLRPSALDVELVKAHGFGPMRLFMSWVCEREQDRVVLACAIAHRGYDVQAACATMAVGALYVAPEARGAGLARMLIAEIAETAVDLGVRELTITTGLENAAAHRFFAAIGAAQATAAMFVLGRDQIEWLAEESA